MKRITQIIAAVAGLLTAAGLARAADIAIGSYLGGVGRDVRVEVVVQPTANISSARLQINYDPGLVAVTGVTNGPGMPGGKFQMYYKDHRGSLDVLMACDSGGCGESGTLLAIDFHVNAGAVPGMRTDLVISRMDLGGAYGLDLMNTCALDGSNGQISVVFTPGTDSDGDGLTDYDEQMLNGSPDYVPGNGDTDTANPDTDGDGMPDGWEVAHGLNPLRNDADSDADGDGLSGREEYSFGSNPQLADSDSDGFDDFREWVAGTDPNDRNSLLAVTGISPSAGGTRIDWKGGSSATQYLERSDNLGPTSLWNPFFTNRPPTAVSSNFTDFGGTNRQTFYRIRVGP